MFVTFHAIILEVKRSESRSAGRKRILTWNCYKVIQGHSFCNHPRSSKVDNFGTSRKRVCDLLPISHQ